MNEWMDGRLVALLLLLLSGYRPVEPTSVAIVAAYHSLSIFLLRLMDRAADTRDSLGVGVKADQDKPILVMSPHCVREVRPTG